MVKDVATYFFIALGAFVFWQSMDEVHVWTKRVRKGSYELFCLCPVLLQQAAFLCSLFRQLCLRWGRWLVCSQIQPRVDLTKCQRFIRQQTLTIELSATSSSSL
ncbi:hypothetical protein TB2_044108 [Malus domestica]